MQQGNVVGTVSSGDWGHRVGKNLAYAFVVPNIATRGAAVEIDIIGDLTPARVIDMAPYDPDMTLLRG